jgi:hypothetical protein
LENDDSYDNDDVDISRAWENIRQNIKASAAESLRLLWAETV